MGYLTYAKLNNKNLKIYLIIEFKIIFKKKFS